MDLDTIFAVLAGADKTAAEDNPYTPWGGLSKQVGQAFVQNSERGSTKENVIAGLLTGILGGSAENAGERYQDKQNTLARDLLKSTYRGGVFERPEGMNPSVFNNVSNVAKFFREEQDLESNALASQSRAKVGEKLFETELTGNPYQQKRAAAIAEKYGFAQPSAPIEQPLADNKPVLSRERELLGQLGGGGAAAPSATTLAVPRTLESYLEEFQGDETQARAAQMRDIQAPERLGGILEARRKEFAGLPEVKEFNIGDTGYKALVKAMEDTSGASDVEIVRRVIQSIEPGLAVRTDDQTAIAQSASIPDSYKAQMLGALNGESKLADRAGLFRIAQRAYSERAAKFNAARSFYLQRAESEGLDPNGITYLPEADPKLGQSASFARTSSLAALARQFPNTPEGKAQFKAEANKRGLIDGS